MATNFPGSLDSFTNPTSSSTLDSPSHAAQHANINDAMEAVQAKLGVGAGTIGEWTSYNATVSQGGSSVSLSTNAGYYIQINELVIARFYLVPNATGSANDLIVSLPVNTGSTSSVMMGPASVFDSSLGQQTIGTWFRESASTIDMSVEPTGRYDTALGSGDIIRGVIMYEVA